MDSSKNSEDVIVLSEQTGETDDVAPGGFDEAQAWRAVGSMATAQRLSEVRFQIFEKFFDLEEGLRRGTADIDDVLGRYIALEEAQTAIEEELPQRSARVGENLTTSTQPSSTVATNYRCR